MQKHSKQRDALIELLKNTKEHPSADALYTQLRKEFPNVSLATVYRNLKLLLEMQEIIKVDVGDEMDHYDACPENHSHFVCEQCHSILDVAHPPLPEIDARISKQEKLQIKGHSLVFYGLCPNCQ